MSCAADGAPAMMGKKKGCLKLLKNENPNMLTVHCVIHRENLVAKKLSPVLNEILQSVIKCVNSIKANAKYERLFRQFCVDKSAEHVRLLLHTEVRWLSKGNCLKRFMELFDELNDFYLYVGGARDFWYEKSGAWVKKVGKHCFTGKHSVLTEKTK